MSLAFQSNENQEYATKSEIHYMLGVSYGRIAEEIRLGKLAIHLIDNKIKINVAEAKEVLKKRTRTQIAIERYNRLGNLF
jgi:hypothetical protein